MSRFLDQLLRTARDSPHGMTTGAPRNPVRRGWPEVHATARRMSAQLPELVGTPVGVLAGEPASIAPAAQAVWLAGGSVTMLHQPTARTDLAGWAVDTVRVLEMIGAGLVLLGPPFEPLAEVLREKGIAVRAIGDLDSNSSDVSDASDPDGPGAAPEPPLRPAGEDDLAFLQLTSGSTAEPKAVRITHGNLYANASDMVATAALTEDDVMVSWLPLFHDMGMVGFLTLPMTFGLELVTVTPLDFLSRPLLWAELISSHRGTITAAPNFAYAVLARQLARADAGSLDLSSMRFALNGAEPIDPAAVAAFTDAGARFGLRPESVVAAYGMAETALAVSFAPRDVGLQVDTIDAEQLESHRRAVPVDGGVRGVRRFPLLGPPLPGLAARVVGDDGRVLGDREVGVIQLRGEAVTPGYLTVDGPVATRDADGWLDTGDEGYLTDGTVVVCGRRKDVIIMAGRNIYPTDVERAAGEVDGVRAGNAVAVRLAEGAAGVAGGRRESFLVAVESRRAGDASAERIISKEVTAAVVREVGARPAAVIVLAPGTLPKTPSGKLRRAATREMISSIRR